jgi:protein TonB
MSTVTNAPDLLPGFPTGDASLPLGSADGAQVKPPEPPQPPVSHPAVNKRVRLASLDPSQLIHRVQPAYPKLAQQVRVQGQVIFAAVISRTGTIENLQLVSGHPLLVLAARDAILQWRYKPTLLGGEPVEVVTNIVVNFTLNEP